VGGLQVPAAVAVVGVVVMALQGPVVGKQMTGSITLAMQTWQRMDPRLLMW
jgi:hypothetical protein